MAIPGPYQGYFGLYAVALVALFVVLIIAAFTQRRRGDWTRRGLVYHFIPIVLFILFIIFSFAAYGTALSDNSSTQQATLILNPIAVFIQQSADSWYNIVFIMLISGFRRGFDGGKHLVSRIIFYVTTFLLWLYALAGLAVGLAYGSLQIINGYYGNADLGLSYTYITGAWFVLEFVVVLLILIYAAVTFVQSLSKKHEGFPKMKVALLLAAAVVNFIRYLYQLIVSAKFALALNGTTQDFRNTLYAEPIVYGWFTAVMSALIVAIGFGKTWFVTPAGAAGPGHSGIAPGAAVAGAAPVGAPMQQQQYATYAQPGQPMGQQQQFQPGYGQPQPYPQHQQLQQQQQPQYTAQQPYAAPSTTAGSTAPRGELGSVTDSPVVTHAAPTSGVQAPAHTGTAAPATSVV